MKNKIFKPRIVEPQQLSTSTASTLKKDHLMVHNSSISQIMSHDYLKTALEDRVNKNALDAVVSKMMHN